MISSKIVRVRRLKSVKILRKCLGLSLLMGLFCYGTVAKNQDPPSRKMVRILSIDGGGIRGIIPAMILHHIESRLLPGLCIADCFDIIAGTSTGGLIALMLTIPNERKRPKYTANEILSIYKKFGKDVFSSSFWGFISSGNGWWGAKYPSKPLEKSLQTYFGNTCLKDCLTNVLVPAYEIEQDKTFFFKSSRAKKELAQDCYLKDLARATSAAPTYFPPATLIDGTGLRTLTLIDGGLAANNPTLAASVYAIEMFGKDIDFFIVSLGTGTNYGAQSRNIAKEDVQSSGLIGWAHKIIPVMMYAVNDVTNYEMYHVFNHERTKRYFRFQPILESKHTEMDNADPDNVKALETYAAKLINAMQEEINEIVQTLNTPK